MADPYIHSKNAALLESAAEVLEDDSILEVVQPKPVFEPPIFYPESSHSDNKTGSIWMVKRGYLLTLVSAFAVFLTVIGFIVASIH